MARTERGVDPEYAAYGFDTPRDGKKPYKAPAWYKRMKQRLRRARANRAIRKGREPEREPRTNDWDWN